MVDMDMDMDGDGDGSVLNQMFALSESTNYRARTRSAPVQRIKLSPS
jgi:hypothetical protein